ncbi:hypothetical protein EDB89DRAFT_1911973 [Lactarius sanguifluus]|nr:hypothetical protein EDB89DRAFT_1911973 [Lactarius sanguifluus]
MTPHANSVKVNTNPSKNRYALLNPNAMCNEIPETATTHGWTVVTHKQKRTTGRDAKPTPSSPNPPTNNPCLQPRAITEVEAHAGITVCGDAHAEVEAHAGMPAHGDAHAKVEAHTGVPARGDARPSPVPSPDPGVAPLTKRLDTQSDVLGVAHMQSPRMAEMLRKTEESCPSNPHVRSSRMLELRRRIRAATETSRVEEACPPIPNATETHRATTNDGHDLPDDEQTSGREDSRRAVDPMCRAKRYCQTLGPLTDDERDNAISQYLMEGRWTDEEEEEDAPVKPAHRMLPIVETNTGYCGRTEGWGSPREATDANYGCQSKEQPAPDDKEEENPVMAINTLTDEEREELREVLSESDAPLTKADLWRILGQIKDRRHHNSPEVHEEETNPTVTTDLIHMPGSVQLPSTQTDKTLAPGDTLDDEELWDAFTRDDREDMLSQLLRDDDTDDDIPRGFRGSNARYGSAYRPSELEDPDSAEDTLSNSYNGLTVSDRTYKPGYLDDEQECPSESDDGVSDFDTGERDEQHGYGIPLQRAYPDDPAIYPQRENNEDSGSDGDTLSDLYSRPAYWTYKSKDEDNKSFDNKEGRIEDGRRPLREDDAETSLPDSHSGLTGWTNKPVDSEEEDEERDNPPNSREEGDAKTFTDNHDDNEATDVDREAQHDVRPFINEGQYNIQPFIAEEHDEGDPREEIELELHGLGQAHGLTATPTIKPPSPRHDYDAPPFANRVDSVSHDLGMTRGQPPRTHDLSITLRRERTGSTSHDLKGDQCTGGWEGQLASTAEEGNSDSMCCDAKHTPDAGITYTQDLRFVVRTETVLTQERTILDTATDANTALPNSPVKVVANRPAEGQAVPRPSVHLKEDRRLARNPTDDRPFPDQRHMTRKASNATLSDLADDGSTIAEGTMPYALTVNHERPSKHHDDTIPPDQPDIRGGDPVAITSTLPRSAQWCYISYTYTTVVGATVPLTCPRVDARASRPMFRPTYHGRAWPRAVPTQHLTTLLDILSRPPEARYLRTQSSDASRLHPTTSLAYVPPRVVIMEADCLRRGVISPSSGSSTTTNTRQGTNRTNVADNIMVRGETTTSPSRLRVTQPTEHKVARDWEDMRHLRDYTPTEEIPVDPTRCSTYRVRCRENGFHSKNGAIQTVLTLHAQSRTANAREDSNDDETCNVPACHDVTRPHCTEKVNIARQSNSRRNDTVNHLDQLQRQNICVSQDHTLENVIGTSELHSINPTFEFNALESYEDKARHSSNPLRTNATYESHLREGFTVVIGAGDITNGGNAALTGHARSDHAYHSTKEYELLDYTLTRTNPTCLIKACLNAPTDEGEDYRPEHTPTDSADIEAAATTGDQPSSLDVVISITAQTTGQPDNNRHPGTPMSSRHAQQPKTDTMRELAHPFTAMNHNLVSPTQHRITNHGNDEGITRTTQQPSERPRVPEELENSLATAEAKYKRDDITRRISDRLPFLVDVPSLGKTSKGHLGNTTEPKHDDRHYPLDALSSTHPTPTITRGNGSNDKSSTVPWSPTSLGPQNPSSTTKDWLEHEPKWATLIASTPTDPPSTSSPHTQDARQSHPSPDSMTVDPVLGLRHTNTGPRRGDTAGNAQNDMSSHQPRHKPPVDITALTQRTSHYDHVHRALQATCNRDRHAHAEQRVQPAAANHILRPRSDTDTSPEDAA